jgi:hypothetical protein
MPPTPGRWPPILLSIIFFLFDAMAAGEVGEGDIKMFGSMETKKV